MIPSSVRIFVCTTPVDMRRGFDGLARVAREALGVDPRSGSLCCFINRRGNRLKVLWFEPSGYCLLYKRAHGVRFVPPTAPPEAEGLRLDARGLRALLEGVEKPKGPGRGGRRKTR